MYALTLIIIFGTERAHSYNKVHCYLYLSALLQKPKNRPDSVGYLRMGSIDYSHHLVKIGKSEFIYYIKRIKQKYFSIFFKNRYFNTEILKQKWVTYIGRKASIFRLGLAKTLTQSTHLGKLIWNVRQGLRSGGLQISQLTFRCVSAEIWQTYINIYNIMNLNS